MSESKSTYILACDIGGTHITSAIVACDTWSIFSETIVRKAVNSAENAKSIFYTWGDALKESLSKFPYPIDQIGIAMPGPFDYEKGISLMKDQNKYDSLYQMNITDGLQEVLERPDIEFRYINDAAAFLQGEIFATGLQSSCILGITLGTGLGSAVWHRGTKAYDADLWNTPHKEGIFEEYLVTRWFTARFAELSGHCEAGLKEIIEKHSGTTAFQELIAEYRENLYQFLKFFSEKHQCRTYIIGGNIAKAWSLIHTDRTFAEFDIHIGQYEEKAALIGAASQFEL